MKDDDEYMSLDNKELRAELGAASDATMNMVAKAQAAASAAKASASSEEQK